ncbi:MAG: HAD-IIA family hydrolase, partial [Chloroflexota bacterium]
VLWHGETPAAGLPEFFSTVRRLGLGFILATNNATRTAAQYRQKLAGFGVDVPAVQILNSAEATAAYLGQHYPAGTPLYTIGEAGLRDALTAQGFTLTSEGAAVVVAGLHKHVCYEELATATLLIHQGARFVGTNPDVTFPSERGPLPGAGAILAFLSAATGVEPTIIGKPYPALFAEALRRLGGAAAATVMVGDRLNTDIAGGRAAGLRTILLLSGISTRQEALSGPIRPDWIFEDLQDLTTHLEEI